MKDLITLVKRLRNRQRQSEWRKKLRAIHESFNVEELNGILYLMCNDVPYKEVPESSSAIEITSMLNEARAAMTRYETSKDHEHIEEK